MLKDLFVEDIRVNGDTQSRVSMDVQAVQDYAASYETSKALPPIVVFHYGDELWLADGFHRVCAARKALMSKINADVRDGSREDAQWYAIGANQTHGLRRSNADKRRAADMALAINPEWSDYRIAEYIGVSQELVRTVRNSLTDSVSENTKRITKSGREMETKHIGVSKFEDRLDGEGNAVPAHLVAGWDAATREVNELIMKATELKRWIEHAGDRIDGLAADIAISAFTADCNNLLSALRLTAKPYAICSFCKGDGCSECAHRGWLSKQLFNCMPEELKE